MSGEQGSFFGGPDTLAEARTRVYAELRNGSYCPCCDQLAQLRGYKLDSGIAYALILFYRLSGPERRWVHYTEATLKATGTKIITMKYTLAKHWGLLEKTDDKQVTGEQSPAGRKNSRGLWRPTETVGRPFIEGRITVPRKIWVYNDTCYGTGDGLVTIRQALGDPFDYDELMRG